MRHCHIEYRDLMGPLFGPRPDEATINERIINHLRFAGFDVTRPFNTYHMPSAQMFIFTQEPRIALGRMLPDWNWATYALAVLYWAIVALVFLRCLL